MIMKILYDISFITPYNLVKGIPVHSLRILNAISINDRKDILLLINKEMTKYVDENLKGYSYIIYPSFHGASQKIFNRSLGKFIYKHIVEGSHSNVLIVSDEYRPITNQRFKVNKCIFIHDLKGTKADYAENVKDRLKYSKFFCDAIKTADIVFAISQYTKDDISKTFANADMEKIHVLYNGVEMPSTSEMPKLMDGNKPYILSINFLDRYKNVLTTIQAFDLVANDYPGKLVIVSKPTEYWDKVCLPFIEEKKLRDRIVLLSDLSVEEIKWLYENADLFVSSSSHEGFGFTPIEAAICCCPVICTDAEALPETTLGLLNYYTPATDCNVLANRILQLLNNPTPKSELMRISELLQNKYSPERQVARMKQLLSDHLKS